MNKTSKIAIFTLILTLAVNVVFAQDALHWQNLGNRAIEGKRYDEAIKNYSKCIELDARAYLCVLSRGAAYLDLKQYQSAINDFSKFIIMFPNHKGIDLAYNYRANAYFYLKEYQKVTLDYTSVIQIHPDANNYFLRGLAHAYLNSHLLAVSDFTKAIELNPKEEYFWNRSIEYCGLGEISLAKADERKVIEIGGKVTNPCTANANQNSGNSNQPVKTQPITNSRQPTEAEIQASEVRGTASAKKFDQMTSGKSVTESYKIYGVEINRLANEDVLADFWSLLKIGIYNPELEEILKHFDERNKKAIKTISKHYVTNDKNRKANLPEIPYPSDVPLPGTSWSSTCECGDLTVIGPASSIESGDTVTFTARLTDEKGVTYKWEVDKGKIISGQGTSTIKVSTTGLADETLTATVVTKSSCEQCTHTESETGIVMAPAAPDPEAFKLDEFESLVGESSKARLDAFTVELQNQPSAGGYILNFGTKKQVEEMHGFIRNYLNTRKFDLNRVVLVNAGEGRAITQFWIVPDGADLDFDTTPGKPVGSGAESPKPKTAEEFNKRGVSFVEKCQYQDAVADFTNAIKLSPKNGDYYSRRAFAYLYIDTAKAEPDMKRAEELWNSEPKPIFNNPDELFRKSDEAMYRATIASRKADKVLLRSEITSLRSANYFNKTNKNYLEPKCGLAKDNSANTNQNSGNSNQTGNSTASSPKTASEYFDSGEKFLDEKDFDGAIRDFTEAIRLMPQDSFYYSYRAQAFEGKNLLDKSLADYSKAIELNNDYSLNYDRRSKVYRKLKRYNEALDDLDYAIKLKDSIIPASFYIMDKIEIYREMKNHSAALKEINDLITKSGKYSEYLSKRAEIKTDLNEKRGAIADYTEIIETYGNLATLLDVYLLKISLHRQLGENAKAEQDMQSYQKINYLLMESKVADKAAIGKDFTKAIGLWNKLIDENSTQSYLYYDRGSAYEKMNQTEKAADDFKKSTRYATRISDKFYKSESHKKLAQYYYKKGNFQVALFEINESIKTGSVSMFSEDNREFRGNIYFALGEYEKAIKDFEEAKEAALFFMILPEAEKNLNAAYCKIGDSKCKK